MYELIVLLFDICRLRKGPQDVPYSLRVLKINLAAFAAVRYLIHYGGGNWLAAFVETGAEIGYIGAFSGIMLYLNRRLNRFYQVASAFFGVYALIGFVAWPAVAMLLAGHAGGLTFLLLIGITVWFCVVTAHIVYHALAPNLFMSLGWALVFLVGFVLMAMSYGAYH
ncbi:MAG: hypothetical protein ACU83V_12730 [Gammaproteobacteria bacterium]